MGKITTRLLKVIPLQERGPAKDTLAKVRERGSNGFIVQADVNQPEEIRQMMDRVKREFGSLDFFVNNARPEIPELRLPF